MFQPPPSEIIWFCLSAKPCVRLSLITSSRRVLLAVFSLGLLSSPDPSTPEIHPPALLCGSEFRAKPRAPTRPCFLVCRFADAGEEGPGAPRRDADPFPIASRLSGSGPGAQRAPGAGHGGASNIPEMRLRAWHEEECLMWPSDSSPTTLLWL